jgi:hypothetical protein
MMLLVPSMSGRLDQSDLCFEPRPLLSVTITPKGGKAVTTTVPRRG